MRNGTGFWMRWWVPVVIGVQSFTALAGGIGIPPLDTGSYTPANVGAAGFVPPSTPGYFSPAGNTQGCDWAPIYGDAATQNLAFPEANTTYWQASPPLDSAAGTQIDIAGQFPNARFFSISLYNSAYEPITDIYDYQLAAASGAKPFLDPTRPNQAVRYGQSYSAHIVFAAVPALPAANTLYVTPDSITAKSAAPRAGQRLYLLYRVYVPYGSTASGDVPLPALSIQGQPFSTNTQTAACQNVVAQVLQNVLYTLTLTLGQLGAAAPTAPQFTVYKAGNTPGANIGLNGANQYMSAATTMPAGQVYIIRGKAPSHTASPTLAAGATPDTRYWSICQNGTLSTEVIGCVGDFQAITDSSDYYHIVVSAQNAPPPYADARHGFNWMPFGPRARATVIYRQLLPDAGFSGAIGSASMGDYTPQIAYCKTTQFEAAAAAGNTAEQIFQSCAASN